MKICNLCKIEKPLTEYLLVKNRHGKRRPHHQCNDCRKAEKRRLSGCKPKAKVIDYETKTKECSICKEWKPFSDYHANTRTLNGTSSFCKLCAVDKSKVYYQANKDKVKIARNQYYHNNKDKVMSNQLEYTKRKYKSDSLFLLKRRCRARIYDALRKKGWTKKRKFAEYIGCSEEQFKAHIESLFTEGMSWDKVHNGDIHIDHHFPLSLAKTEEDVYRLCHYTNLKPMWAVDNIRKSNKLPENTEN